MYSFSRALQSRKKGRGGGEGGVLPLYVDWLPLVEPGVLYLDVRHIHLVMMSIVILQPVFIVCTCTCTCTDLLLWVCHVHVSLHNNYYIEAELWLYCEPYTL